MALGGVLLALGFIAISFAQTFNHVLIVYGVLVAPGIRRAGDEERCREHQRPREQPDRRGPKKNPAQVLKEHV